LLVAPAQLSPWKENTEVAERLLVAKAEAQQGTPQGEYQAVEAEGLANSDYLGMPDQRPPETHCSSWIIPRREQAAPQ
jgi:hypothetical protein